jgi:hypothetical protein
MSERALKSLNQATAYAATVATASTLFAFAAQSLNDHYEIDTNCFQNRVQSLRSQFPIAAQGL